MRYTHDEIAEHEYQCAQDGVCLYCGAELEDGQGAFCRQWCELKYCGPDPAVLTSQEAYEASLATAHGMIDLDPLDFDQVPF